MAPRTEGTEIALGNQVRDQRPVLPPHLSIRFGFTDKQATALSQQVFPEALSVLVRQVAAPGDSRQRSDVRVGPVQHRYAASYVFGDLSQGDRQERRLVGEHGHDWIAEERFQPFPVLVVRVAHEASHGIGVQQIDVAPRGVVVVVGMRKLIRRPHEERIVTGGIEGQFERFESGILAQHQTSGRSAGVSLLVVNPDHQLPLTALPDDLR